MHISATSGQHIGNIRTPCRIDYKFATLRAFNDFSPKGGN